MKINNIINALPKLFKGGVYYYFVNDIKCAIKLRKTSFDLIEDSCICNMWKSKIVEREKELLSLGFKIEKQINNQRLIKYVISWEDENN